MKARVIRKAIPVTEKLQSRRHFIIRLPLDMEEVTGVAVTSSITEKFFEQGMVEGGRVHLEAEGKFLCDLPVRFDFYDAKFGIFPPSILEKGFDVLTHVKYEPLSVNIPRSVSVLMGYLISREELAPYTVNIYIYYNAREKP